MDKKRTSNQSAPAKRRVQFSGSAVARPRASATLTVRSRPRDRECSSKPAGSRHRAPSTEHRIIPLTQGKFAIVDAEDYERLARHKWYAHKKGNRFYAARKKNGRTIRMHREIMNVPPGMVCDHKNHDTLDNRKSNLRICTPSQNQYNKLPCDRGTSRYKGVYWSKDSHRWRAGICHRGKKFHLGCYDYEADAAIAYDDMAVDLFGEFACLNLNHRPEIRLWMERTYLFEPTRNDLRDVMFNEVKRARKTGRGRQNGARLESAARILRCRPELALSLSKA